MCEVGSCCGCICLYKGSLIIGLVTILSAVAQLGIFSLILYTTYDSKSGPNADEDETSLYCFVSNNSYCPFGFVPLSQRGGEVVAIPPTEDPDSTDLLTTIADLQDYNLTENFNGTYDEPRINSCLAPPQGILWALVVASAMYIPAGVVLMVGVKLGISCLLSAWFFYSVAYNLVGLITALTDGVYAGASDVSSYIVCLVTAYCIIIVDSYYEKLLLRTEKTQDCMKDHQPRPSLVVANCTPTSANSSESPAHFATPMGRLSNLPPGYAPCATAELPLPSASSLRPTSPV